jgi:hypothetical protein
VLDLVATRAYRRATPSAAECSPASSGGSVLTTTSRAAAGILVCLLFSTGFAQQYVPGEETDFPRIQYADSLVSVNDRCIVRLRKLSPKIPPIFVNGLPIGFC